MDDCQLLSNHCLDLSDLCEEDFSYWDFLPNDREKNEISQKENDLDDISDMCKDDCTFWDFLPSDQKKKEISQNADDFLNSSTESYNISCQDKKLQGRKNTFKSEDTTHKKLPLSNSNEVPAKALGINYGNTSKGDDDFWDFLNKDRSVPENIKTHHRNVVNNSANIKSNTPVFNEVSKILSTKSTSEGDDDFWDFLKFDNSVLGDERFMSTAELEELRSLSSITPFSVEESGVSSISNFLRSKVSSTENTIPGTGDNYQNEFCSSEDICRDMDLLLAEISTIKESDLCEQSVSSKEKIIMSSTPNNKHLPTPNLNKNPRSVISTVSNKNPAHKIRSQSITIPDSTFSAAVPAEIGQAKINNRILSQNIHENIAQSASIASKNKIRQNNIGLAKHAENGVPYVLVNNPYLRIEENLLKNNSIKIVGSKSTVPFNTLHKIKPLGCKVDAIKPFCNGQGQFGSQNTASKVIEKGKDSKTHLPDIPSNVFSQPNASLVNHNTDLSGLKSSCVSPTKQKSVKRLLPRNSPKNSIFKITDHYAVSNAQYSGDNAAVSDTANNKRQKTGELENEIIVINQEGSIFINQKCPSPVKPKTILMSGTNNVAAPNTAPIYLVIPNSFQSGQNQNAEIVMVLNNGNPKPNNSENFTNCAIPVSSVAHAPGIINSVITNSNHQITNKGVQQTSLPTFSVISVPQNTGATGLSNNLKPVIVNESMFQSMISNIPKQQVPITTSVNSIITVPTSMPQNLAQANNVNIYSAPQAPPTITAGPVLSRVNVPIVSLLPSNIQPRPVNPEMNQQPLGGISGYIAVNSLLQPVPTGATALQCPKQIKQRNLKPIKTIPLGKDKNAIQQISVPIKIADIINSSMTNNYDNSSVSANSCISQDRQFPQDAINKVQISQPMQQNKVFDFVNCKTKPDSLLVKRNIITNETEIINKNKIFNVQCDTSSPNLSNISFENKSIIGVVNSNGDKKTVHPILTNTSGIHTGNTMQVQTTAAKSTGDVNSVSQTQTGRSQKSTLATLQQLFPPPISMIPVCVMQTVQTTSKPAVSKVVVLQNANTSNSEAQLAKNQGKLAYKKMTTVKGKKLGRKTVRELLQERKQQVPAVQQTKILKSIFKLTKDGPMLSAELPIVSGTTSSIISNGVYTTEAGKSSAFTDNSSKRPNIMILPSAAKVVKGNFLQEGGGKNESRPCFPKTDVSQMPETCSTKIFDPPSDFLFHKMVTSKDYRPRYYDMCELRIGYFKVEDDVDSCGGFRSKFKVLFTKRLFVYDFPVMKCNQMDLSNSCCWEQIARIQVPFNSIVAMTMSSRTVRIQVNRCPQVCLKKIPEQSSLVSSAKTQNNTADDTAIWLDSVQNSSVHKITLRKRQADNLKTHLCQFDAKFLLLFSIGSNSSSILNASLLEDEVPCTNFRKVNPKNKRNVIRRLPQWDSENVAEPVELMNGDHLVSSNHVCSCRISCRSLRCSCVKAAKSCGTGGAVCLCTNCDNPLNILESFGISLDFSLSDCCLFQNIYEIPELRNFLQRDATLSCCDTVARVLDCIPGTILCPNIECNARLEFSWCRRVICYPDRNPRNHCSFCGQCCFSNGRHCPICNKCYQVTSKCPDCPNCRGSGFALKSVDEDFDLIPDEFISMPLLEPSSAKTYSKPEIIVLDAANTVKSETETSSSKGTKSSRPDDIDPKGKIQVEERTEVKNDTEFKFPVPIGGVFSHCDSSAIKTDCCLKSEEKYRIIDENKDIIEGITKRIQNQMKSGVKSETETSSSKDKGTTSGRPDDIDPNRNIQVEERTQIKNETAFKFPVPTGAVISHCDSSAIKTDCCLKSEEKYRIIDENKDIIESIIERIQNEMKSGAYSDNCDVEIQILLDKNSLMSDEEICILKPSDLERKSEQIINVKTELPSSKI